MATPQPVAYAHLVNLAADATGAFVIAASDDYFAEKENLLKPSAPEWRAEAYTDKGKWMDGWESQRRADPYAPGAHDWLVIRLGVPGSIEALVVDTTHFKGNAPQAVAVEVIDAPAHLTRQDVLNAPGWLPILEKTPIKPDAVNELAIDNKARATHVRLRAYPDGGIARLRCYGHALPDPTIFWGRGSVDLAAIENGGQVVEVSDQFFGPPSNLLLPGRGVNMGDGWETKRRRTPGTDWCVIRLGRRGTIDRLELDTHFFKGNAPQRCTIEAMDELQGPRWSTLVPSSALEPHRRHQLLPVLTQPYTHLRVHIWPHGGVNRLRVYGASVDGEAERAALAKLQGANRELLLSFNGSTRFADVMKARLPSTGGVREALGAFEAEWWKLEERDWLEAFAAHPRIGQSKAATATTRSTEWSKLEQALAMSAEDELKAKLATLNDAYLAKFGFIYLVCATGKPAAELVRLLEERLENDRATELLNAAREQALITRLRLHRFLLSALGL